MQRRQRANLRLAMTNQVYGHYIGLPKRCKSSINMKKWQTAACPFLCICLLLMFFASWPVTGPLKSPWALLWHLSAACPLCWALQKMSQELPGCGSSVASETIFLKGPREKGIHGQFWDCLPWSTKIFSSQTAGLCLWAVALRGLSTSPNALRTMNASSFARRSVWEFTDSNRLRLHLLLSLCDLAWLGFCQNEKPTLRRAMTVTCRDGWSSGKTRKGGKGKNSHKRQMQQRHSNSM